MLYIGPPRDVVHIHIPTLGKILDLYGESYRGRSPSPRSRVYPEKEPEIVGIDGKLACVHTICVQV